jgi:glycerophosphoryl diester phosphodiesterase
VKIIGHAGARGLAPANTIAAIKMAIEYKVDAIEFDVQVTKDHVPVLHHNPYLRDLSGSRLQIAEQTLITLRRHKPDLATLEGAIRIIDHAAPLHIELKRGIDTQPVIAIIQQFLDHGWHNDELWFVSFDLRLLRTFHHAFPACPIVVIESWSGIRATKRARSLSTPYIAMNQRWLWSPFIHAVARRGYKLSAYTVNTLAQARRFEKAGLDAITTDFPDRFAK